MCRTAVGTFTKYKMESNLNTALFRTREAIELIGWCVVVVVEADVEVTVKGNYAPPTSPINEAKCIIAFVFMSANGPTTTMSGESEFHARYEAFMPSAFFFRVVESRKLFAEPEMALTFIVSHRRLSPIKESK